MDPVVQRTAELCDELCQSMSAAFLAQSGAVRERYQDLPLTQFYIGTSLAFARMAVSTLTEMFEKSGNPFPTQQAYEEIRLMLWRYIDEYRPPPEE